MKMLVVVGWEGAKGGEMGPPRGSGGPLPSLRMAERRGSRLFSGRLPVCRGSSKNGKSLLKGAIQFAGVDSLRPKSILHLGI